MSAVLALIYVKLHLTNPIFINYSLKCPSDSLERGYRSSAICSSKHLYHCLYEDHYLFVELCQNNKQLPKGNYPRYSCLTDNIYYEECRNGTYQPHPAKSFDITDCPFKKSICVSEGQVICSRGTADSDTTCRCDYKNDYAMLQSECCSPLFFEDCSCYKKICPLANQEMVPDYNCFNKCEIGYERKDGKFECTKKNVNSINGTSSIILRDLRKDSDEFLEYNRSFDTDFTSDFLSVAASFAMPLFVICFCVFCVVDEDQIWIICIAFVVITFCLIFSLISVENKLTCEISISVCMLMILCVFIRVVTTICILEVNPKLVNTENDQYLTDVLLNAAANGDNIKLDSLHQNHVDMNLRNNDGKTALHLAVANGHLKAVTFLVLHAKVAVMMPDRHNRYPKDETTDTNILQILEMANENQCRNHLEKLSRSDLTMAKVMKAASGGFLHTIQDSFTNFEMDSADYSKETPLHAAAANARLDDVKFLLQRRHVSPFVRNR